MSDLPCATCGGTGWISTDSAYFPQRDSWHQCRDCMGTGICPAGSPVTTEFDDEYEVDHQGQIHPIHPEQP